MLLRASRDTKSCFVTFNLQFCKRKFPFFAHLEGASVEILSICVHVLMQCCNTCIASMHVYCNYNDYDEMKVVNIDVKAACSDTIKHRGICTTMHQCFSVATFYQQVVNSVYKNVHAEVLDHVGYTTPRFYSNLSSSNPDPIILALTLSPKRAQDNFQPSTDQVGLFFHCDMKL